MTKGTIPGSSGKKLIYYRFLQAGSAPHDYFILFHGSFSTSFNEKNETLAGKLVQNNIGNVYLWETSRQTYSFETKVPFEEYKGVFGPKTFQEELADVKSAFAYFVEHLVTDKKRARYHFIGFSLGGTQCSYLLPGYGSQVKNVFLFGSGVTTRGNGSTYPGYPAKEEILANYRDYEGKVHLIQGSQDTVVPKVEALEVLAASKGKVKNHIVIEGVDHSFRKLNGQLAIPQIGEMIYDTITAHLAED